MGVENLVGLRRHGRFYTGVISHYLQKRVSKVSVGQCIKIIGWVIIIWDKVLFRIRVSSDGMVSRNKLF